VKLWARQAVLPAPVQCTPRMGTPDPLHHVLDHAAPLTRPGTVCWPTRLSRPGIAAAS